MLQDRAVRSGVDDDDVVLFDDDPFLDLVVGMRGPVARHRFRIVGCGDGLRDGLSPALYWAACVAHTPVLAFEEAVYPEDPALLKLDRLYAGVDEVGEGAGEYCSHHPDPLLVVDQYAVDDDLLVCENRFHGNGAVLAHDLLKRCSRQLESEDVRVAGRIHRALNGLRVPPYPDFADKELVLVDPRLHEEMDSPGTGSEIRIVPLLPPVHVATDQDPLGRGRNRFNVHPDLQTVHDHLELAADEAIQLFLRSKCHVSLPPCFCKRRPLTVAEKSLAVNEEKLAVTLLIRTPKSPHLLLAS